jgi:hypothetical protein
LAKMLHRSKAVQNARRFSELKVSAEQSRLRSVDRAPCLPGSPTEDERKSDSGRFLYKMISLSIYLRATLLS